MSATTKPSPTHRGTIRRRAARLAQQGVLRTTVESADGEAYTVVTAAGDVATIARRDMPAYLTGLAHGAFAVQHPIPVAGVPT